MHRPLALALLAGLACLALPSPASASCTGEGGAAEACSTHQVQGDCDAGVATESSGVWLDTAAASAGVRSQETCYRRADGSVYQDYLLFAFVEIEAIGLYWWPAHYAYAESSGSTDCQVGVDSLDVPADCERVPREHPAAWLP